MKIKYNKYTKAWQVIKTSGIFEEVLFENKDKDICKIFIQNKKLNGGKDEV